VRYEDGQEVTRETEAEWTASEPETQLSGYGTQVQVRSMDTPAGPIEYWRSVTVYATSYSPCRLGTGTCNTRTASGAPLQRGIIAVSTPWYRDMAGQSVYIPGYGRAVIGDVGGGIPGEYWIDLGFSDEDYESWHSNVTLYFLTPVPPAIPYILP
jgi:3D (Asp-Asp-Asp) domain-containing protein